MLAQAIAGNGGRWRGRSVSLEEANNRAITEPAWARFLAYCGLEADSPEAQAFDAQFDALGLMVGKALLEVRDVQ